jgi:hypothetical protein
MRAGPPWQCMLPQVTALRAVLWLVSPQMTLRSLCFHRLAKSRGDPWRWWDYVYRLGKDCAMADKKYTAECALSTLKVRPMQLGCSLCT